MLIRANFYYETLPTDLVVRFVLEPPVGVEPEEFAQQLYARAQNFASYTEDYDFPMLVSGSRMWPKEYNSNSFMAGLLHSVMGIVPPLDLYVTDQKHYQAPGWETPMPDSSFKGKQ